MLYLVDICHQSRSKGAVKINGSAMYEYKIYGIISRVVVQYQTFFCEIFHTASFSTELGHEIRAC